MKSVKKFFLWFFTTQYAYALCSFYFGMWQKNIWAGWFAWFAFQGLERVLKEAGFTRKLDVTLIHRVFNDNPDKEPWEL